MDCRWSVPISCAFSLAALSAYGLLVQTAPEDLSLSDVLRRALLSVIFLGATSYAIQQSSIHRDQERRYRSIELELASLEPYIVLLPEDLQQLVKMELADRYFAGHNETDASLDIDNALQRFRRFQKDREQQSS